jgi:hypothetical protein
MTDDERLQKLKDDYRDAPIAQIEYELGRRLRAVTSTRSCTAS